MNAVLNMLKRKRIAFPISVAAIASLAVSPLMSGVTQIGIEKGRDLLAMLDARSPGGRPDGVLVDTKLRRAAADLPSEYAMPKTRERPSPVATFLPDGPVTPAGIGTAPLSQISDVAGPSTFGPGGPFTSGPGVPGPSIFNQPPPDPVNPLGPQDPGPNPVTAVPEPTIWLNMLLGFGAIAVMLRSRRRKAGATPAGMR